VSKPESKQIGHRAARQRQGKPKRGKILAIGDGKRLENGEKAPFSVKKGDEVIFTSYAGTEIKLDGEEIIIMSEDDVTCGSRSNRLLFVVGM